MVETDEQTLREIEHKGDKLLLKDLILLIERHHPDTRPGVSRETIDAYVDALAADPDERIDAEAFYAELDDQLTDSETWAGRESIYELGPDRISRYPKRWHDRLGGTTDIREYVAFLEDEVPSFNDDIGKGGQGPGIPQQPLLDIVATVGQTSRSDARAQLEDLREQGELAEDADQHPDAGVVLRDRHGEFRDPDLDK